MESPDMTQPTPFRELQLHEQLQVIEATGRSLETLRRLQGAEVCEWSHAQLRTLAEILIEQVRQVNGGLSQDTGAPLDLDSDDRSYADQLLETRHQLGALIVDVECVLSFRDRLPKEIGERLEMVLKVAKTAL